VIELRRATEVDHDAMLAFIADLTPDASWLRFAAGIGRPSSQLVAALIRRDATHGAWIAVRDGDIVGHTSWSLLGDGSTAEIAAVVAEAWRRSGLGRLLGRLAADDAADNGAQSLRLEVLPSNLAARGLLLHLWPHAVGRDGGGLIVYDVPLRRAVHAG
jgi:ribosomal protein S18 acetylase RimI-like enzyme